MIFKNNLKNKIFVLVSSLLIVLSSFVVGISAYFITRVSVSAAFTVDIYSPQLIVETLLGISETSPVYVSSKVVSIKGSTTDTGSGIKMLTVNGKEVLVGTDGSWSIDVTLPENKSTAITIVSTDKVGKITSRVGYLYYDDADPTLGITTSLSSNSSSPTQVANAALSLTGTYSDANGVTSVKVNGEEAILNNGIWSTTVTLTPNTTTTLTITVTDKSGRTTTLTRYVYYDSSSIGVSITAPTGTSSSNPTYVKSSSYTVTGTYSNTGGTVSSIKVGSAAATFSNNAWSCDLTLSEGLNTITVTATNSFGKTATDTKYVYYDNTAPTLTVLSSAYTTSTSYTISGIVSDANGIDSIKINNSITATVNSDGTWSATITLTNNAENTITVIATDKAGNTNMVIHVVGCNNDMTGPILTITNPGSAYTGSGTQYITVQAGYVVSGTVSDSQSGVASVIVDGKEAVISGNTWSAPICDSDGESRVILVEAVDHAGNKVVDHIRVIFENSHPDWEFTYCYGSKTSPYVYNQTTSITVQLEASSYNSVASVTFNGVEAIKRDNYGGYSYIINKDDWGEDVVAEYEVIVTYNDGTTSVDYTYAVYSPNPVITANRTTSSSSPYYIDSKTDGDLILSGTVTDTGGITSFTIESVNGGPIEVPLAEDGSYSYNIGDLVTQSLFEVTAVKLTAVDIWGNVTTKTIYFKWYI